MKLMLRIEKKHWPRPKGFLKKGKEYLSTLQKYVEGNQPISATPIADSLRGILKKAAGNKSYEELRAEALKVKYDV